MLYAPLGTRGGRSLVLSLVGASNSCMCFSNRVYRKLPGDFERGLAPRRYHCYGCLFYFDHSITASRSQ
jgi:hypothetical protein